MLIIFAKLFSDEAYATHAQIYVVDLTAAVRSIGKVPDTFRQLSTLILTRIPVTSRVVYVACDTYQELSIKNAERQSRGMLVSEFQQILRGSWPMATTRKGYSSL